MKTRHCSRRPLRAARGVMLLEALVAILVFSLGVLALVGLQAAAVRQSSEAKYRADAAFLADQLIGQMWVSNRNVADLQSGFQTDGSAYNAWKAVVASRLPGVAEHPPAVVIAGQADGSGGQSALVTITVEWKAPNDPADQPARRYTAVTQIR